MKKWKMYLIASIIFLIITGLLWLMQYGIANGNNYEPNYVLITANSFEVSGLFSIASGILYWTSSEGAFDGISYATKQVYSTLFRKTKYPYTFSEYKLIKHPEDERIYIWHLIIVGLVLLFIGFIVYTIFR